MANLGNTYDASQGDAMDDRSVIPPGKYALLIAASDIKETKNGAGKYIEFELAGFNGDMDGRKHWVRLNLWNQNAQAVEIAQKEFTSICRAVGKLQVSDTTELHGIPMYVTIGVKKRKDTGEEENVIKKYEPYQQQPAGGTTSAPPAGTTATTTAGTSDQSTQSGPWS
jgi:hypothetical protein